MVARGMSVKSGDRLDAHLRDLFHRQAMPSPSQIADQPAVVADQTRPSFTGVVSPVTERDLDTALNAARP